MSLHGVIFDMGGTLLHYTPPGEHWEGMEKRGAQHVYRQLAAQGYTLPPEDEALQAAWDYAQTLWMNLDAHAVQDLKLYKLMRHILALWNVHDDLPQASIEALGQAYMAAIQATVRPLDGAVDTLRALRDQGFRVGLISNTHWPGAFHRQDLDRYGVTPYLEHLVFSADVEAWKPHPAIFKLGLEALGLAPQEAVYVGDSLYFDVWGAQQAGLRGVWIEQPRHWLPEGIEVAPDATITGLPDLLPLVQGWRE